MILYHGSIEQVTRPEIRQPQRTLDYGSGFYATTSFEQAERWVRRRMREKKLSLGYINTYDFDLLAMQMLKTLSFSEPTEEWVDFVMANRVKEGFTHDYDIVYGPVANDHVYTAFALYEGRVISKQALIAELRTYTLVDQYLFHTERSLQFLSFLEAKEITL
ncbi:MAG: DUF3990 domain-containing protein [Bacteroidaceae bacterium]|nr:DUF3990 domain-containing protein [Bacteroidaceae bacterium]MBR1791378.1 DUF3990 domain-containing protein [Bacteroidaceae bacterium]